jgi:hypothetical protein
MNAMQQHSVNKDNRKTNKLLVGSVSAAALAVGLSFPIGSAILSNAQSEGSQMGGAPGAAQPANAEEQTKADALAVVKQTYDFRPTASSQAEIAEQTDANAKSNLSEAFYGRYTTDKKVLAYDPLTHTQDYARYTAYGPAYINGDTVYVAVDQFADPEGTQKLRDLVVTVDTATNKITGVAGEYK